MSEHLPPTTNVPRIIPRHPRRPCWPASLLEKDTDPKAAAVVESVRFDSNSDDDLAATLIEQAARAESKVIARLSPDQGTVVLFSENSENGISFAAPQIELPDVALEEYLPEELVALEPGEEEFITAKTEPEEVPEEAVVEAEAVEEKEESPRSDGKDFEECEQVDARDEEEVAPETLPKVPRKARSKSVAVSGEASPFNARHVRTKKGFWERRARRAKAKKAGAETVEEKSAPKPKAPRLREVKRKVQPEIDSWVGEVEDEVVAYHEESGVPQEPTVRAPDRFRVVSRQRRARKRLAGAGRLVGKLGLAAALVLGVWGFWQYDGPLPDDGNIAPEVADERHRSSVHMQLSHFLMRSEIDNAFGESTEWKEYDPERLEELLKRNGGALELINMCLAEKNWETDHPAWKAGNLGGELQWDKLARVKQAEALYLQRRGLEVEAFRAAFDLMEFGRKVQGVEAWPNYYLTGLKIYDQGMETVEQLVADTRMNSAQLGALQRTFAAHLPPGEADLVAFFRASYGLEKAILIGKNAPARPEEFKFHMAKPDGVLFKPNRTLALFSDMFGMLISDAGKPIYQRAKMDLSESESPSLLDSNRTGREYFAKAMEPYLEIPQRQALSEANYELVKTSFALRRHVLDMGRLPETLADMDEKYLKAVPTDPFDGDSLRYSRFKKVVYSAGIDGVDDGGKPGLAGFANLEEPTLELPFSTGGDSDFH